MDIQDFFRKRPFRGNSAKNTQKEFLPTRIRRNLKPFIRYYMDVRGLRFQEDAIDELITLGLKTFEEQQSAFEKIIDELPKELTEKVSYNNDNY